MKGLETMTVRDLIEELSKLPQTAEVRMYLETETTYFSSGINYIEATEDEKRVWLNGIDTGLIA